MVRGEGRIKRIFHDTWKLCEILTLVSMNKAVLEHRHGHLSRIAGGCPPPTAAEQVRQSVCSDLACLHCCSACCKSHGCSECCARRGTTCHLILLSVHTHHVRTRPVDSSHSKGKAEWGLFCYHFGWQSIFGVQWLCTCAPDYNRGWHYQTQQPPQ